MPDNEFWFTEEHSFNVRFSFKVNSLLFRKQSEYQLIEILDTPEFGRVMALDGKVMVTDRDEYIYHEMLVHPSMCLHPSPKRVLVIGGGDGGTVREIFKYPDVERVVLAEIDEEVINISRRFFPQVSCALDDSRVEKKIVDAADLVRTTTERFDVCFIDCTDPAGIGSIELAEVLITDEFLDNLRCVLEDDGIMVAQSESPVYSIRHLRRYVARLKDRFRYVAPYVIMVPSYAGLWSLTWASKTIEPSSPSSSFSPSSSLSPNEVRLMRLPAATSPPSPSSPPSEITRTPPQGLRYFTPELFRASLEMGKLELWGPRPPDSTHN